MCKSSKSVVLYCKNLSMFEFRLVSSPKIYMVYMYVEVIYSTADEKVSLSF